MADKGKDPLPIFKKSISLTKNSKNIEILWASTREAYNYTQAKQINCDIITCLLYTSPSPRDGLLSRMPSSA